MRFEAMNPGPVLTCEELDAYCAEHALVLPDSLKRQLLDQNGGVPSADTTVPLPDGDETDLFCLFGLMMRNASGELASVVQTYAGRVPAGLVPFANDSGGNLFLVDGDDLVCFWDHEQEGSPAAALPMNVSLDRFLAMLTA